LGSLLLTGLVSILSFQQTRQSLLVNAQVREKTRQLSTATRALAKQESKLRAVVDNTVDGMIIINDRGIVESFNRACERMFGYQEKEVAGQNINRLMPEPYHSNHDHYISRYLETGQAKIIGTPGRELTAKRKDGSVFPIDLSISTFQVGNERYFSGIIRDITARKKAEEERETYLRELEISNRELDDFAYIASHDLKEPLRGLQNFSKFLLEDYADKLGADGKEKLLTISDLTKRLEDCLNALLHYSRLGRTALAVRQTDLTAVVQGIIALFSIGLREKNTEVVITRQLPTIVCDHVRITEVFQNLIGNAIKYNNKDGNRIEVGYVENHRRFPGEKVYYVRDHGIGIRQEYIEEVFKIFRRLHPKNAYGGGTGSGLTIARKIIKQHGGEMWAESAGEGQGTTFFFTIPPPAGAA
ncbi:MAG: PAS domain S-box protein, partial [Proteobacteria bacterium]|nr:PAS domain S-box protein [Pseudomonadota bacterium]